jgi:hypothetical protein
LDICLSFKAYAGLFRDNLSHQQKQFPHETKFLKQKSEKITKHCNAMTSESLEKSESSLSPAAKIAK